MAAAVAQAEEQRVRRREEFYAEVKRRKAEAMNKAMEEMLMAQAGVVKR